MNTIYWKLLVFKKKILITKNNFYEKTNNNYAQLFLYKVPITTMNYVLESVQ